MCSSLFLSKWKTAIGSNGLQKKETADEALQCNLPIHLFSQAQIGRYLQAMSLLLLAPITIVQNTSAKATVMIIIRLLNRKSSSYLVLTPHVGLAMCDIAAGISD